MINININMMGIFQEQLSKCLTITIPNKTNISMLREILINEYDKSFLNFSYLIRNSVFSNKKNILSDDYILSNNDDIYLLPPFSGG